MRAMFLCRVRVVSHSMTTCGQVLSLLGRYHQQFYIKLPIAIVKRVQCWNRFFLFIKKRRNEKKRKKTNRVNVWDSIFELNYKIMYVRRIQQYMPYPMFMFTKWKTVANQAEFKIPEKNAYIHKILSLIPLKRWTRELRIDWLNCSTIATTMEILRLYVQALRYAIHICHCLSCPDIWSQCCFTLT